MVYEATWAETAEIQGLCRALENVVVGAETGC